MQVSLKIALAPGFSVADEPPTAIRVTGPRGTFTLGSLAMSSRMGLMSLMDGPVSEQEVFRRAGSQTIVEAAELHYCIAQMHSSGCVLYVLYSNDKIIAEFSLPAGRALNCVGNQTRLVASRFAYAHIDAEAIVFETPLHHGWLRACCWQAPAVFGLFRSPRSVDDARAEVAEMDDSVFNFSDYHGFRGDDQMFR